MSTSNAVLTVEHLSAAPGERVTGLVPVNLGTATVEIPIVLVNGAQRGPRVGVTAGLHGEEYVAIAALRRVAMAIDPAEVTGSLVASLTSNPAGFAARAIYVNPIDGRNLNRAFPGDPVGEPTARLAAWIWSHVVQPSDRFLDLHGGNLHEALAPFTATTETGDAGVDTTSRAMADAYALDYMVEVPFLGTSTNAAAAAGIPALLAEIGSNGLWPEEDVALHAAGLRRALHVAGLLPAPGEGPRRSSRALASVAWLDSDVTGFWHPAVALGQAVEKGQVLGEVQDPFGVSLWTVTAPQSGVVISLITSLAMNAGEPIVTIGD